MKKFFEAFSNSARWRSCWVAFYRVAVRVTKQSILSRTPWAYRLFARYLKPGDFRIFPGIFTDLVVETAGSSASCALVEYIKKHNPGIRVAYGCEAPAPVIHAVRLGLPVIITTRNMLETAHSGRERFQQNSPENNMRSYYVFCKAIYPYYDQLEIADYYEIVANPCSIVARCNRRFGTNFNLGDNVLPRVRHTEGG